MVYCNIVWGTAKTTLLNKLFVLQKGAMRLCAGAAFRSSSSPLFVQLKKLKLSDINILQISLFMHKLKFSSHLLPHYCFQYGTTVDNMRIRNTRMSQDFKQPAYKNHIRKCSLTVNDTCANSLPRELRQISSFCMFKHRLVNHLLDAY